MQDFKQIPTSFDKAVVSRLSHHNLIRFYWKVVNALDQYASDEALKTHENNCVYLVHLIGFDPICESGGFSSTAISTQY